MLPLPAGLGDVGARGEPLSLTKARGSGGVKLGACAARTPAGVLERLVALGMAGRRVEVAGEEEGEGVDWLLLLPLLLLLTQGWLAICSSVGRSSGTKESSHRIRDCASAEEGGVEESH